MTEMNEMTDNEMYESLKAEIRGEIREELLKEIKGKINKLYREYEDKKMGYSRQLMDTGLYQCVDAKSEAVRECYDIIDEIEY